MSDKKWAIDKDYGHNVKPCPWGQSGSCFYEECPLNKKSFRAQGMPVFREDFLPATTQYVERSQDEKFAMSSYGCHRNLLWDDSLRMPRNPFPGRPTRETKYVQEPSPNGTMTQSPWTSPRRSPMGGLTPRSTSRASTPRGQGRTRPILQEKRTRDDNISLRSPSYAMWSDK
ncbi:unnamed protein product [Polarella glacialis]|uniref:Uncharacterized protein n=1 Tax=Polarella glacialis TaxID=89957 RepID=A0A813JWB2_POLGL|nr:unnamed protein product [Polarella glacialis]|mmetsp:Transcript_36049/g.58165  ORF Transcript_36049/g.58165 Transcript_36049/m.58165 type:complete len:172 (+) Transcript_36049:63-578(+)